MTRGTQLSPLIFDKSLEHCVIFDLDGTLACIGDRSPYDAKACSGDLVNESVAVLNRAICAQGAHKIFIFSGRTDDAEKETLQWLRDNDIRFYKLVMRKKGDFRKDAVVKQEMFNHYIKDQFNVAFAVDDRKQVVELWRSLGIPTFQVAQGDF